MVLITYKNFYFYIWAAILFLAMLATEKMIKNKKAVHIVKKTMLLTFSFLIICTYDWRFCFCILFTGAIIYFAGLGMEQVEEKRKRIEISAVVILCVFLGVFKYGNYFLAHFASVFSSTASGFRLLFPIGISFYIFSAIGYVVDVADGKIHAERNFFDLILFLAFFPKIVCGPIAKASDFLPQLKEDQPITYQKFEIGIQFWLVGLFKKIVLADRLALFVDAVYSAPGIYSTATVWLAAFTYFLQMYLDFSGYSDMAWGVAKIFGYELPKNFNLPYISSNITDFWNRWHMSLTGWLTEYVFNPTAMSLRRKSSHFPKEKKKQVRMYFTYLAIVITFLVSGIWHGVGAVYLVWGLCHGILSVIHAAYATWIRKAHPDLVKHKPRALFVLDIAANMFVVIMLEALFRAETFSAGLTFFHNMFTIHNGIRHMNLWTFLTVAVMFLSVFTAWLHQKKAGLSQIESYYPIQNLTTVRGLSIFGIFFGMTIILGYFQETFFVYGNF